MQTAFDVTNESLQKDLIFAALEEIAINFEAAVQGGIKWKITMNKPNYFLDEAERVAGHVIFCQDIENCNVSIATVYIAGHHAHILRNTLITIPGDVEINMKDPDSFEQIHDELMNCSILLLLILMV